MAGFKDLQVLLTAIEVSKVQVNLKWTYFSCFIILLLNFDLKASKTNETPVSAIIQYRLAGGDLYDDSEFIAQGTPRYS